MARPFGPTRMLIWKISLWTARTICTVTPQTETRTVASNPHMVPPSFCMHLIVLMILVIIILVILHFLSLFFARKNLFSARKKVQQRRANTARREESCGKLVS